MRTLAATVGPPRERWQRPLDPRANVGSDRWTPVRTLAATVGPPCERWQRSLDPCANVGSDPWMPNGLMVLRPNEVRVDAIIKHRMPNEVLTWRKMKVSGDLDFTPKMATWKKFVEFSQRRLPLSDNGRGRVILL